MRVKSHALFEPVCLNFEFDVHCSALQNASNPDMSRLDARVGRAEGMLVGSFVGCPVGCDVG